MTIHTALRVRRDRLEQIRAIALAREMTVADLLTDWINREIAAGTIAPDLPGVEIEIKPAGPSRLTLGDIEMLADDSDEALAFSKRLRDVATRALKDYRDQFPAIFRNGPGVVIEGKNGQKFTATPGMAKEIADRIHDAVVNQVK